MIKIYRETEKAIQIGLRVENTILDKEMIEKVWIPKSQLDEKGFPKPWILGKKVEELFGYNGKDGNELRGVEVV